MSESMKNFLSFVLPFLLLIGAFLYFIEKKRHTEPPVITEDEIKPKNDTIYIRGLGKYQKSDLKKASKIIKEFYGFPCKIIGSVKTIKYMYSKNGKSLDDYKTLSYLKSDSTILYVTDEKITQGSLDLRGAALPLSNNIIVVGDMSFMKSTLIHEIGHLLGLDHCNDLTCVMALNNDEYDSGDFCGKCKKIINWTNI
jgi:hypothetical protein